MLEMPRAKCSRAELPIGTSVQRVHYTWWASTGGKQCLPRPVTNQSLNQLRLLRVDLMDESIFQLEQDTWFLSSGQEGSVQYTWVCAV